MPTPTYATVINQINNSIFANGNNEITANILNPILKLLIDFSNNTIGNLSSLTTDQSDNIVNALNSLKDNINGISESGIKLFTGFDDPNLTPPPIFNIADFYIQLASLDNSPIDLWQYKGITWVSENEILSTKLDRGAYVGNADTLKANIDAKSDQITTYTKLESDSLITQVLGGAPADANTLKELNDKIVAIQAIVGGTTADGDSIVNTIAELLAVFATFSEGSDLVLLLDGKVNTTDVYNALDSIVAGKVLDSRQGKVLNDLIVALQSGKQNTLVSGTNIKTINGTTLLGSGNIEVTVGGGGTDYLYFKRKWRGNPFSLNTWTNPGPTTNSFATETFGTYGTSTTPTDLHLYATSEFIPDGYIIDQIELVVIYKSTMSASSLQIYIDKAEVNYQNTSVADSNTVVLVNEVVNFPAGDFGLKFSKILTIPVDVLPTLNKALTFESVRELTLSSCAYSIGFNYKYKKV